MQSASSTSLGLRSIRPLVQSTIGSSEACTPKRSTSALADASAFVVHADQQRRQTHDRAEHLIQIGRRTGRFCHLQQRRAYPRFFALCHRQLSAVDRHGGLVGNPAQQRRLAPAEELLRRRADPHYAIEIAVRQQRQTAARALVDKAAGYGIAGTAVDGNDVLAVYEAARHAAALPMPWPAPVTIAT